MCQEKNIDLTICNLTNLKIDSISITPTNGNENNENQNYESQLTIFEQYLFKSSRYCVDYIFKKESDQQNGKRILFVKENTLWCLDVMFFW